ncbi:transposase [Streptomyces arenae]|nr:transposase [Streptomyces arenae]
MHSDLVPDDVRERTAPLIPPRPPRRHRLPGRSPVAGRTAPAGIVYVLRKGVSRADVPAERIGCSAATCRRRLRDWTEAGGMDPPPCHPARRTATCRTARQGRPRDRRLARQGPQRGGAHRAFTSGPQPSRQQAPCHRRPPRHPTRHLTDRRQPARRHPAHPAAARDLAQPRPPRPSPPQTQAPARPPPPRLPQAPPTPVGPRHRTDRITHCGKAVPVLHHAPA